MQQREFEEGLVNCYRKYLENCENEIRAQSVIGAVAVRCLCELLKEKSYFNFSINIIEVVVKTLGRRNFDEVDQLGAYANRRADQDDRRLKYVSTHCLASSRLILPVKRHWK